MKKLIICACVIFSGYLFADMPISADKLPQNTQKFISDNFQGVNITHAEQDNDSYGVILSNGYKFEFYKNGEWKEIENYAGVNPKLLPYNVATTIAKTFPNVNIIKVEKEWNGIEVKMANRMEALLDNNGKLLKQKMDD